MFSFTGFTNNNIVVRGKDYYVSFNPRTEIGAETALCEITKEEDIWYNLKGNFSKEFSKCKTLKECKKVFFDNIEFKSKWSTYDL